MPDYAAQRDAMVRVQLQGRGIRDPRVLEVMRTVPRHRFVPERLTHYAYEDGPLAIGCGQTISQPYMVALMSSLLDLSAEDRALEIGTGSGYQTAVLAALAREVFTVERWADLSASALARLAELGCTNVHGIVGDGTLGWADAAPFEAILVTAGGPHVPQPLLDQLAMGGRLVCPVGGRESQVLHTVTRKPVGFEVRYDTRCMFVPLVGEEGW